MYGVYRNLNAKKGNNGADLWSITNAHPSTNGYLVVDKGVTHGVNFSIAHPVTNNPTSIAKGCKRILAKHREVCAIVGGEISQVKPQGLLLGRLTLDLASGTFQIITADGRIPFDGRKVALWFADGCQVFTI